MPPPKAIRTACLLASMFSVHALHAQTTIYVDDDASAGGDGSSWQSAYRFLSDALATAELLPDDNIIRIAEGVYKPDQSAAFPAGTGDHCATFFIPDFDDAGETLIEGGYRGTGTAGDPNDRDTDLFATILSGDLNNDDPTWPFTGSESEWGDNTEVLLSSSRGPAVINGLRFKGARRVFFDGARNLIDTTGVRWWTRDVRMTDCIFSDAAPNAYSFGDDECPDYIVHDGHALYFGHYFDRFPNVNTVVDLVDVTIKRVVGNQHQSLIFFGGGDISWRGGGMQSCTFPQGVEAHTFNGTFDTTVLFENLVFEHINLAGQGYNFEHIVSFKSGVESIVRNCAFRNIDMMYVFNFLQPILQLEDPSQVNDTSIQKVVDNCTFENITADTTNNEDPSGVICLGATLVTGTDFHNIVRPREALAVAQRIESCTITNCNMPGSPHESELPVSQWLIDGEIRTLADTAVGIRAFEIVDVLASDNYIERTLIETAGIAENCTIYGNQFIPIIAAHSTALLVARPESTILRANIHDNIFGSKNAPHISSQPASCGALLHSGSSMIDSVISNNSFLLQSDATSTASAVYMFSGTTVFNCVITQNGFPVNAGGEPGHVAVYAAQGPDPYSIINSTICGNAGDHVAGIEINWSGTHTTDLLVANCIVADNITFNGGIFDCPDLESNFTGVCDPQRMQVVNTLTTPDMPTFVDPAANNYRPAPGSVAVDAGDNSWLLADIFDLDNDGDTTEPYPLDYDGNPRVLDDTGTPDPGPPAVVDIGAYEFQGTSPPDCPVDVNHDGMVTPTDFTAWINAFNNQLPECDQNNDGACTPTDFTAWINNFNAGCP